MKHSNQELCHLFARNTGESAENQGGSMFIENDTIYSYGHHFPMARHTNGVVLITIDSYSSTTAQHMSTLRSSLGRHLTTFHVANVIPSVKADHVANFKDYTQRFNDLLASASRARSNKEWKLNDAIALANEANKYADHFKLRNKRIDTSDIDLDSIKEKVKAQQLAEKKKAEKAERAKIKAAKQNIIDWQNCVPNARAPLAMHTIFLRVNGDVLETSRHARIPMAIVPQIWDAIKTTMKEGKDYISDGSEKIGHYTMRGISKNGDLLVDCHHIKFEQLKQIAVQLEYEL